MSVKTLFVNFFMNALTNKWLNESTEVDGDTERHYAKDGHSSTR